MKAPRWAGFKPASQSSSETKRRIRAVNTGPEMCLRKALWRLGFRYRLHLKGIPGRPDIVFRREKVAVFCDGDFFHGRNWEALKFKLRRRANPDYWIAKIQYNRDRDRSVNEELARLGWKVIRFWGTDVELDPTATAKRVAMVVEEARREDD